MGQGDVPGLPLAEAVPVLERSFSTWADVPCTDLVFPPGRETDVRAVGYEEDGANENLVLFRARRCDEAVPEGEPCRSEGDCANRWDCWGFADTVIAVTTTTFSRETGEIVDADIEFNAASFDFTVADGPPCEGGRTRGCVSTDLENTATHEIGHLLGLDHSPLQGSTMYASAPLGETSKRSLSEDDAAGICAIYPAGLPPSVCASQEGAGARETGCACGTSGRIGLEALLLVVPFLRRRSARRRIPFSGGHGARSPPERSPSPRRRTR